MALLPRTSGLIFTVYDREGKGTPYFTRVKLTPLTRWGQGLIHVFYRGDADPDPHDHPWPFWTFPLVSYAEEVLCMDGLIRIDVVRRFRLHRRHAGHVHRVLGPVRRSGRRFVLREGRIVTLVWRGKCYRDWLFWCRRDDLPEWTPVPWRDYISHGRPS